MPTDPSTDPATATTRRSFLTRTAVGGALVTAGAMAFPLSSLLPPGRRPGRAVRGHERRGVRARSPRRSSWPPCSAYQVALDTGLLDASWTGWGRSLPEAPPDRGRHHRHPARRPSHHAGSRPAPCPSSGPTPCPPLLTRKRSCWRSREIEETLAATHLSAISVMIEKTTAKTVTQVLAVEGQQAALLAVAGGSTVESVTPATNTSDAAVPLEAAPATTTTTAAELSARCSRSPR